MKNFTKSLLLVAAGVTALSANADATWELNLKSKDFTIPIQSGRGIMADWNNDGVMDLYYSGSAPAEYYNNKPEIWGWQASSNMIYFNADGTFTEDFITTEPTGEFTDLDEDGNPTENSKEKYRVVDPKHGIIPISYAHYASFDYNNDGLVDLLAMGVSNNDHAGYINRVSESKRVYYSEDYTDWGWDWDANGNWSWMEKQMNFSGTAVAPQLFKNLGDGRFELVYDCNLPIFWSDGNQGRNMALKTIAWGDYDHDGYVDLALSGVNKLAEDGEIDRVAQLWRNLDGTGRFEQMNIAETKGGSWIKEVKEKVTDPDTGEEVENIVIPAQELPGHFLLLSGNVNFADVNNDGWLDLLFDGWADYIDDKVYEAGSNGRLYINTDDGNGGRKFVDATDPLCGFYLTRSGSSKFVDYNKDGYLDLFNAGYGDHGLGWKTLFFFNNLGDDPTTAADGIYTLGDPMAQYGLPDEEAMSLEIRDFDGDDILDFLYVGRKDEAVFYGDVTGMFTQAPNHPIRGFNIADGFEALGDLDGDGLVERFQTGYTWISDNAEMDGVNYREMLGTGDWAWGKWLWNNTTDVELEAPEAPTNVEGKVDLEAGTITVTWTDIETAEDLSNWEGKNVAYNVVVQSPSGKIISNLPVDPVTGFIKVTENKNIAVRPLVQTYTLPFYETGEYKVGVQALSLTNELYSPITWGAALSNVGEIAADLSNTTVKVSVNGDNVIVNADATADVQIVDMLGRTVATGVTNTPINVAADGVLIVTVEGKSVKVVK